VELGFPNRSVEISIATRFLQENTTAYQVASPLIEPGKSYDFAIRPLNSTTILGASTIASALVDGITALPVRAACRVRRFPTVSPMFPPPA